MEEKIACVFCKGEANVAFEELNLLNGKITLRNQPYYRCNKCKKEFVTPEQMLQAEKELKTHFAFNRPVISSGRSLVITLPTDLVAFYKLKKGTTVKLVPEDNKTVKLVI